MTEAIGKPLPTPERTGRGLAVQSNFLRGNGYLLFFKELSRDLPIHAHDWLRVKGADSVEKQVARELEIGRVTARSGLPYEEGDPRRISPISFIMIPPLIYRAPASQL